MKKRLSKKGGIHVDWVVSMGIFLIYLLLLIVFLKPVYKPTFESDTLIQIVKNGFLNELEWNVNKTLLIIENCDTDGKFNVQNFNEYFPVEVIPNNNFGVFDNSMNEINFGSRLFVQVSSGKNILWVVNSEETYTHQNPTDTEVNCNNVIFGEKNLHYGIKESKLPLLNYENFKSKYSYPDARDFKIMIPDNSFIFGPEPYQDAIIHTFEWKHPVLDKNTNTELKTIIIQVW